MKPPLVWLRKHSNKYTCRQLFSDDREGDDVSMISFFDPADF